MTTASIPECLLELQKIKANKEVGDNIPLEDVLHV
jgi:hypothetical protein